ncbi:MAG: T9SS type A sorting domain-containing protein [bacterium]
MKKFILLLLLFISASALAQPAKILVCAPGNLAAAKFTDSVLATFYADPIDVSDTITDGINKYEAVFLCITNYQISTTEGITLKKFLHSNNKLYIEYSFGTFYKFVYDNFDSTRFWGNLGIKYVGFESIEATIEYVDGIQGTFTQGLHTLNHSYSPGSTDVKSVLSLFGVQTHVLTTQNQLHLAYSYSTDSFKVVMHWRTIPDYYSEFLHRVLCNYFGLCAPVSVKQTAEKPSEISLFPNPARDVLHIWSSQNLFGFRTAELVTETGSLISTYSLDENRSQIDLDLGTKRLTRGNYFLRLNNGSDSFLKPVYLLGR